MVNLLTGFIIPTTVVINRDIYIYISFHHSLCSSYLCIYSPCAVFWYILFLYVDKIPISIKSCISCNSINSVFVLFSMIYSGCELLLLQLNAHWIRFIAYCSGFIKWRKCIWMDLNFCSEQIINIRVNFKPRKLLQKRFSLMFWS